LKLIGPVLHAVVVSAVFDTVLPGRSGLCTMGTKLILLVLLVLQFREVRHLRSKFL